jgi:MFS_1 like family
VRRSLVALNAVNFFMADVAGGLGPFLGVYLQERHWHPAEIGLMMTIGGRAGMVATAPLGALVDNMHAKRGMLAAGALAIVAASLAVLVFQGFAAVSITSCDGHCRSGDRPGVYGSYARSGWAGGIRRTKRTQSGLQPCRQCHGGGARRRARLLVWLLCGVCRARGDGSRRARRPKGSTRGRSTTARRAGSQPMRNARLRPGLCC